MVECIETLAELKELIADEDTIIYCEEDKQYYRFYDGEWNVEVMETPKGDIHMSVYEMNKQILAQLPVFTEENWQGARSVFEDWYKDKPFKYYMLYGREIGYFTLFHEDEEIIEFTNLFDAIAECLGQFDVKAFDVVDEAAIEIWIDWTVPQEDNSNSNEKRTTCMYLFPYDDGVVNYGR